MKDRIYGQPGRYLVGDDFHIPFEIEETPEGGLTGYTYDENGKRVERPEWLMKLLQPGKAAMATDEEFEAAKKARMGG